MFEFVCIFICCNIVAYQFAFLNYFWILHFSFSIYILDSDHFCDETKNTNIRETEIRHKDISGTENKNINTEWELGKVITYNRGENLF